MYQKKYLNLITDPVLRGTIEARLKNMEYIQQEIMERSKNETISKSSSGQSFTSNC